MFVMTKFKLDCEFQKSFVQVILCFYPISIFEIIQLDFLHSVGKSILLVPLSILFHLLQMLAFQNQPIIHTELMKSWLEFSYRVPNMPSLALPSWLFLSQLLPNSLAWFLLVHRTQDSYHLSGCHLAICRTYISIAQDAKLVLP